MSSESVRIDSWLWAARFFKTRSLAHTAVQGGHVQINGAGCKPSRQVKTGDVITLHRELDRWCVTVTALADKRGSAAQAALLYSEDAASRELRERRQQERKAHYLAAPPAPRPDKKQRRQIIRFVRKRGQG